VSILNNFSPPTGCPGGERKGRQTKKVQKMEAPAWRCPACRCLVTGKHSITVTIFYDCLFFNFFLFLQRHEGLFRKGLCASAAQTSSRVTIPERQMPPPDAVKIARRFPGYIYLPSKIIRRRKIYHVKTTMPRHPRDMSHVQFKWRMHLRRVHELCEPAFWQFFLPMHSLSAVAIDTALHAARKTFQAHRFTSFPLSTRTLFQKVMCPHVFHNVSLCL